MNQVFTDEQLKMLNTPLKPNEIEHKQGMSYLKGQLAVVKANQIFGVGSWAYKQLGPIEITDTGVKNSKGNTIYLVSATVELTVRGCETFVEQGDCEAQGMGAPAISMARKGAVTDGLKRCLKNFGAAFGLDLYFDTPPVNSFNQPAPQQQPRQITPQPQPTMRPAPTTPKEAVKEIQHIHATVPVTQPTPIKVDVKPQPEAQPEPKVGENEISKITILGGQKGLDEIQIKRMSFDLYGRPLDKLDLSEGRHLYKVLLGK